MKKPFATKYWWIALLIGLVVINYLSSLLHFRLDLTAEKRYTLSSSTRKLLAGLDDQVNITVFLAGEMPASFTKLRNSTDELLQEFKDAGKTNLRVSFTKPAEGLEDTARTVFLDSLARLGIKPYTIDAQIKEGEGTERRQVVPGALISYRDRVSAVDLLAGQNSALDETSINRVEATLEYKFASAIEKITEDSLPLVGYMVGNGEPLSYNVYDLIENTLKKNYHFRIFPIDSFPTIPPVFNVMIVAKPTEKFTDEQKFKIDHYVMQGGKVLWMIDNLYAEMDSLRRIQNEFIAFDRGLNLDDLLFKYGVRINQDLVQGLNSDQISTVVGDVGGKPQIQPLQWPYFPLLTGESGHPISKNLDYVVAQFPNSIDTVGAAGIKKTILLSTSAQARSLTTPAKVSWNSIQTEEDIQKFNQGKIPVAVLLEGRFNSLYANRLTSQMRDYLAALNEQFIPQAKNKGKMIVISDGDLALNQVTQKDGPLSMGMSDPLLRFKYANSEFVTNCIEYLTDDSGILETRGKDFTLRLLDKEALEKDKTKWQMINIIVPLVIVLLFGTVFQIIRRRSYR